MHQHTQAQRTSKQGKIQKVVATAVLLAVVLGFGGPAHALDRDFIFVNHTGYEVYSLYTRVAGTEVWSQDILEGGTLPNHRSVAVHYPLTGTACLFDVRLKFTNGYPVTWGRVNLCDITEMSVWFDWQARQYRATYDF
jgi:hypothetical protein